MKNQASRSAAAVASARALESIAPQKHRIINDPYASYFVLGRLKPIAKVAFRGKAPGFFYRLITLYANTVIDKKNGAIFIALRHRYIDEKLQKLIDSGIKQVVLLGAGYDSRAIRFAHTNVRFIEIDHPATQKEKLRRIKGIHPLPDCNISYLNTDFQGNWLDDVMSPGAIKPEPTIFIWEGVSMYLDEGSVHETLENLKKLCPAGHLIFDVITAEGIEKWNREDADGIKVAVDPDEEPLKFGIDKKELADMLESHQFSLNEAISSLECSDILYQKEGIKVKEFEIGVDSLFAHAIF